VDASGVATKEGEYAAPPAGAGTVCSGLLDGSGALHQLAFSASSGFDFAYRCPLAPARSTVVYTEASAPTGANDFTQQPFQAFVKVDGPSWLVTGP
jgi:hypothetical protein